MSPLQFVRIKQIKPEYSAITSYMAGDVWAEVICESQGILGTEFLIDAKDMLERISKEEVWKKSGLCLQETKKNAVNVFCMDRLTEDGKILAKGNILIRTYPGELEEFSPIKLQVKKDDCPEGAWERVGYIDNGRELNRAIKNLSTFSGLKGDKAERISYFHLEDQTLHVMVTEKGSNQGRSLLSYKTPVFLNCPSFGIEGRHLHKVTEVFDFRKPTERIDVLMSFEDDDRESPSRVCFVGNKGYINLPVRPPEDCPSLSKGGVLRFLDPEEEIEYISRRCFHIDLLSNGLAIQTPQSETKRKEVVFSQEGDSIIISKRGDHTKEEQSIVPFQYQPIEEDGEWLPIYVDHTYLSEMLDALEKDITASAKELSVDTTWGDEEEESTEASRNIIITQKRYTRRNVVIHILYLEKEYAGTAPLRGNLVCLPEVISSDDDENE
jgi:hypothetical protein